MLKSVNLNVVFTKDHGHIQSNVLLQAQQKRTKTTPSKAALKDKTACEMFSRPIHHSRVKAYHNVILLFSSELKHQYHLSGRLEYSSITEKNKEKFLRVLFQQLLWTLTGTKIHHRTSHAKSI